MFNKTKLTNVGKTQLLTMRGITQSDEFAGYELKYNVVHGEEDSKMFLNPAMNDPAAENWNNILQLLPKSVLQVDEGGPYENIYPNPDDT